MSAHDVIVLGTGGVGSAAAFHLARRGLRVLGLDRFAAAHDRGSSHGQTRIIRKAYFEHPDYVPLLERAYVLWSELEALRGGAEGALVTRVGLLQTGLPEGRVVRGVLAAAERHGIGVDRLSAAELRRSFPRFVAPAEHVGVLEPDAGFLRVEACVRAHLEEAARRGADLRTGFAVRSWRARSGGVEVVTDRGTFAAGHLVIAAGPWAGSCLEVPGCALEVRKKPVYWFASHADGYRAAAGCPCFLAELPEGVFYGVPAVDRRGVKLARHTGGAIVDDPTILDRAVDEEDLALVERFRTEFLPGVRGPYTSHGACMYTMSPDEHFIVDRHPEHERVVFAAGLSGHGFKFAGVLGEALADIVTTGSTPLRIGFLSIRRPALERPPA